MIDPKRALEAALRQDLSAFTHRAFLTVAPGTDYLHNWHIDAITHELCLCRNGASKRLLITQPPRSLKSICTSVAYVAWLLGHDPTLKVICVSYSQDLALELSRQFRLVVESGWYQGLFPKMRLKKSSGAEFVTTMGGGRVATSIGGTLTGRGADYIIIDDPLKAEDALSEPARNTVINWYCGTLLTRLNNQRTGRIILVMQRLHEEDLVGYITASGEDWRHLNLPAIADEDERIAIGQSRYHERKKGTPIHGAREPLSVLKRLQKDLGSMKFSSQYQQSPVPAEGNIIKRDWFKTYSELPSGGQIIQSWNLATSTNNKADYSVCVTALIKNKKFYIIDVWRERLAYPDLRRKIITHAIHHNADNVLLEKAGPGEAMVADLRRNKTPGFPTPIGIKVKEDKAVRLETASPVIERGDVLIPQDASWLSTFLNELLAFPNGRNDDQADAFSQLINWQIKHNRRNTARAGMPAILIQA